MEKWYNYEFESSSVTTEKFASFARCYRAHLKKILGENFSLIRFFRGHFCISGFIKNNHTGKIVYFDTSDVRYNLEAWRKDILIRTAVNDKDFTGGINNYCTLETFKSMAERLSK